jgi:hypothetical protein
LCNWKIKLFAGWLVYIEFKKFSQRNFVCRCICWTPNNRRIIYEIKSRTLQNDIMIYSYNKKLGGGEGSISANRLCSLSCLVLSCLVLSRTYQYHRHIGGVPCRILSRTYQYHHQCDQCLVSNVSVPPPPFVIVNQLHTTLFVSCVCRDR